MSVKQVIVVRTDLKMRRGKEAAQCCHASLKVFLDKMYIMSSCEGKQEIKGNFTEDMEQWVNWEEGKEGFTKICVGCEGEEELNKIKKSCEELSIPCALIIDAGKTEFNGVPTPTCIAVGPAESGIVDRITGEYKLR